MKLTVNGMERTFIPMAQARQHWSLPPEFSVALFEPKEWSGLGTMSGAREELALARRNVEAAVPDTVAPQALHITCEGLARRFDHELTVANTAIGLRADEVEFAVSGFANILQSFANALLRTRFIPTHHEEETVPSANFDEIYREWLNSTTRVSYQTHFYDGAAQPMGIRVVYNAYGRVGLEIVVNDQMHYVADPALACPASRYMYELTESVAARLAAAII